MKKLTVLLAAFLSLSLMAQEKKEIVLKGKVTDSSGEPLIRALIFIKDTTIVTATATDFDGNFSLAIPSGGDSITVAYLGYKSKTLPISNNYGNIVLEESQHLEEVFVVTGQGMQKVSILDKSLTKTLTVE